MRKVYRLVIAVQPAQKYQQPLCNCYTSKFIESTSLNLHIHLYVVDIESYDLFKFQPWMECGIGTIFCEVQTFLVGIHMHGTKFSTMKIVRSHKKSRLQHSSQ